MSRSILVIEWLNGALSAVHVSGKEVVASSAHALPIETAAELGAALPALIAETKFSGREAVLVVENRRMVYHIQESPLGRRSVVRRFLERQVGQANFFEGEAAAWGLGQPILVKSSHRYLLTLLPRALVVALRDAFIEEGLRLTGIFSPASVLARCFPSLPIDADRPVLLTAEVGGMLCLVVGKKNGHVWFARSVSIATTGIQQEGTDSTPVLRVVRAQTRITDRLEQELNRTRLFCQQQFETQINKLCVVGPGAKNVVTQARLPEGLSLEVVNAAGDGDFLARHAATLGERAPGNLLDQIEGEDLRQRRFLAGGVAAALVVSIGFWVFTNSSIQHREQELKNLLAQSAEIREQNEAGLKRHREIQEQRAMVLAVGSSADPDVPTLLCRYLGISLPDEFALTQVDIQQVSNTWTFRLEGRCREASIDHLTAIEKLEKQLKDSPFKIAVRSSTRTKLFADSTEENRRAVTSASEAADERSFYLEGIIR